MADLTILQTDSNLRQKSINLAEKIAIEEGIPLTGLTILGGKPYINVTGLDRKIKNLCKEKGWEIASSSYEEIQRASKENGHRAGGWGILKLFDKPGFFEALKLLQGKREEALTLDLLKELRDLFTYTFKMRGWASPDTLRMATMQKPDHIEHMAERRATNRAKREATGTGLTSIDEMDVEVSEEKLSKEEVKATGLFLREMAAFRDHLGDEKFLAVLGECGWEDVKEVLNVEDQRALWKALKAALDERELENKK